jgi:hypothetical protein
MEGFITLDVDTARANDRGGGAHASTKIRFSALNTARIGTKTNVILVCIRISLSYKRIIMHPIICIRHAETVEPSVEVKSPDLPSYETRINRGLRSAKQCAQYLACGPHNAQCNRTV